jgi:pimeloyl-ACP methyl ester carboxylesterase
MRVVKALLILGCILLQACSHFRSVEGPMHYVNDFFECDIRPKTLLVLLPGAYDTPQDYIDQNFIKEVRSRNIYADIQIVDSHIGYYTNAQIVRRLEEEVVSQAKSKGYEKIWFVGISLGGYGSLLYSMKNRTALEGMFLMAPYMGVKEVHMDVLGQGGLKTWVSKDEDTTDLNLWQWLKSYALPSSNIPKLYLGFGDNDRFAKPNGLLADVLPTERSMIIPGGHDWKTWHQLWTQFLETSFLQRFDKTQSNCKIQ